MAITKEARRLKIKRRVRKKIFGTSARPRMSVFKSNTSIYVQVIDDTAGKTIVSVSSKELVKDAKSINIDAASKVGKAIAEKATAAGITSVIFDRNGYLYHGKLKALAEGAREAGLKF